MMKRRLISVLSALMLVAGACGDADEAAQATPAAPPDTTTVVSEPASTEPATTAPAANDHRIDRARGENAAVAAHLVPVAGHSYVDVSETELTLQLDATEKSEAEAGFDVYSGFSWHSIVADDPAENVTQGVEIGFLQLTELTWTPSSPHEAEQFMLEIAGDRLTDRMDIAGTSVFVLDSPQHPDSRFTFMWLRGDVLASVDGAERVSIERWLSEYLEIQVLPVEIFED